MGIPQAAVHARRRSDAGQVRLQQRDLDGLLLVAEHYAAPYDLLAEALGVQPARVRAVAARWRAAGYAVTGVLGPGPAWCWLTPAGMGDAPQHVRAGLYAAFDAQALYRQPMRQATIWATITDTTPGTVAALLNDPRTDSDTVGNLPPVAMAASTALSCRRPEGCGTALPCSGAGFGHIFRVSYISTACFVPVPLLVSIPTERVILRTGTA